MTRVKICGLTNAEDAQVAAEAGADFLGFIFYPPSPRYVSPERVHRIIEAIRSASFTVRCVGVFVDEKVDDVRQTARRCGLDYAQLHGTEPPETVTALMTQGLGAIKAFRVRDGASWTRLRDTGRRPTCWIPTSRTGRVVRGSPSTGRWRRGPKHTDQ